MTTERLAPRARPSQKRSSATLARILDAAARLLEAEGFERLTTNRICREAGLTPPALYRYFPNKYAVLNALAERLLDRQNAALADWAKAGAHRPPTDAELTEMLQEQVNVTRRTPGGAAILRTLYATPQLIELRLGSHWGVVEALASAQSWLQDRLGHDEAIRRLRLAVEIGNSAVEMALEDPAACEDAILRDAAEMIGAYLAKPPAG